MTVVRIKGIKRYRRRGKWYCYHRATGRRLRAEFGTGEFFAELATLERRTAEKKALPGTLGMLIKMYQASPRFADLAPSTRAGYRKIIDILQPLDEMPLSNLTPPFVAGLRDKLADQRGRRTANFVMSLLSVVAEHGREFGVLDANPVKGMKRVRRPSGSAQQNRPWSRNECRAVISELPPHLALPVALAMFTGLGQGDVLALTEGRD